MSRLSALLRRQRATSSRKHPIRYRIWKLATPLNARHMQFAWASLAMVALADLYVRLVASGVFPDPKIF